MHDEIELKLQAPPPALRDILASEFVSRIRVGNAGIRRLVSTYFDTPRHTLRKAGILASKKGKGGRFYLFKELWEIQIPRLPPG